MLVQLVPTSNMFATEEVQSSGMYPLIIGDILPARTFSKPTALHVSGTRLLVCDQGISSIQNIINQNDYRFGVYGVNAGQIHTPGDVTTISNKPYVTDTLNNKVVAFQAQGYLNQSLRLF
ncbi:MAG: hypothetical protein R2883_07895 [Caldisericia bacterium]